MAIDPGIAGLAARKYAIQQEQADSAQRLQQSQAGLTDVQAGLAPGEAAARNFATRGQGAAAYGQANLANTTASLAPQQLSSEDTLRRGQVGLYGAEAGRASTEAGLAPLQFGQDYLRSQQQHDQSNLFNTNQYAPGLQGWQGNSGSIFHNAPATPIGPAPSTGPVSYLPTGVQNWLRPGSNGSIIGGDPLGQNAYDPMHASQGATKVPGKGDGKTDTQPAMLAPGEAVLNRGAAEHLGRDTISLLNAIGARRMGLTIGSDSDTSTPNKGENAGVENQTGAPPGYAEGTPQVPPTYSYGDPRMGNTTDWRTGSSPQMGSGQGQDRDRTPLIPGYAEGTSYASPYSLRPPISTIPGPNTGSWDPNARPGGDIPPAPITNTNSSIRNSVNLRGKPRADAGGDQPQYLAKGTSKVPDKKAPAKKGESKSKPAMSPHAAAHTPTGAGLPPGILEALLSMGQQGGGGAPPMGGGMPGPGAPPPMPPSMPMPMPGRRAA